ncbi:hypothetical protein BREVNS_2379 [Brevinematales bacterium NS]|nr:hypothetical protein BREVNS_2379 [Brevinematales bacterium NS]
MANVLPFDQKREPSHTYHSLFYPLPKEDISLEWRDKSQ